jgi:hypothetical protein
MAGGPFEPKAAEAIDVAEIVALCLAHGSPRLRGYARAYLRALRDGQPPAEAWEDNMPSPALEALT